jgi:phosphotransferase family enzyme
MVDDAGEERLDGGINQVVRLGDTIRRPVGPWSAAVHELLQHLESAGFAGAPRFLGTDDDGREILSYVAGRTPWPPAFSLEDLTDPQLLESVAALLREYHDAIDGWHPTTSTWQVPPVAAGRPEVLCHNDIAPWNLIVQRRKAFAFVDWDTVAPGPRMWDLAYLAYTFVPLAAPENLPMMGWPSPTATSERLTLIRRGYGCSQAQWLELLDLIPARIQAAYDTMRSWAAEDRPGWRAQWEQAEPWRHGSGFLRDLEFVQEELTELSASARADRSRHM